MIPHYNDRANVYTYWSLIFTTKKLNNYVIRTSVWKKLGVDIFEQIFVHHSFRTFLKQ